MIKNDNVSYNLNKFFQKIVLKKQYAKILKNKFNLLFDVKKQNYKSLSSDLFFKKKNLKKNIISVKYIIYIFFSRSNTLLHVMSSSGKLIFFCSAGNLDYKGNSKKVRVLVLKSMIALLIKKLKFLLKAPLALHLKNVRFMKF